LFFRAFQAIITIPAYAERGTTMALTKEDLQAIASLISQSENRIMTYIESHVEKEIHQIADGHKMLYEKVDREFKEIHEELDELKGTQAAQEFVITRRLKQG
jgi:DNA polymerase III delta prime subunit